MLTDLVEASINVALKVNLEKTRVIFNSFILKKKLVYNNNDIKEVQSYVHLRQEISLDTGIVSEINGRK